MRLLPCSILLTCLLAPLAAAQDVYNEINVGTPPNGLFHGGEIDTIQLNNGNLHIEIPLWTVKGRGPLAAGAIFVLDTKEWTAKYTTNKSTGLVNALIRPEVGGTFGGVVSGLTNYKLSSTHYAGTPACYQTTGYNSNFVIREPNGTKHHLVPDSADFCPPVQHWNMYYADDGSGFLNNYTSGVFSKGGIKEGIFTAMDTNGNTIPSGQDTVGRALTDGSLTYYDSSGTAQTIQLTSTSIPIHTNLCQYYDGWDTCTENTTAQNEVTQIRLPNGMTYTINYVQNDMGQPSSITLPSGAQISWNYYLSDKGGPFVSTRTVTANGQANTWNYGTPCVATCTTSIVDPLGNETDSTFTAMVPYSGAGVYDENADQLPFLTTKQIKDKSSGSLIVVKTETTDYSTSTTSPILPIRVTTTWNQTNTVSKVETDYDSFAVPGTTISSSASNAIAKREYDWNTGSPGSLVRRTALNYLHLTNSNYLNANILDSVTSSTVYDSTANTCKGVSQACAQTTYSYDSTSITSTSTTPAPNHDYTGHGYTFTTRGNPTVVNQWVNTTGSWLSTTNYYDDLGNLRSSTDPRGNVITYAYTDNFTDGVNRNAQAFLTQVTRPATGGVNHIEKKQFFWYTSLVAASCGQNFSSACANTYSPPQSDYVKLTYDKMFRPVTITRGDGGVTSASYNDTSLPLSVTATSSITGTTNKTATGVFDDLYRIKQIQLTSDPQGTEFTDTTYDALGRKSTVSNPHRSASLPTDGTTSFYYDALNRPCLVVPPDGTQPVPGSPCPTTRPTGDVLTVYSGNCATATDEAGKDRKSCSDGLSRLTGVWENPSVLNYENDYTYDALDNLLTVNQKGGSANSANWRTRTFTYDSLSRLLCASNPENSSAPCPVTATSSYTAGTTGYTYDNSGNVLTKISPAPNQTGSATVTISYSYDALNRITTKGFSDSTPGLYFYYDVAPAWMNDLTNVIGRLANSSNSSGGSTDGKATAATFSYDAMGRVVRQWQQTPSTSPGGSFVYQSYDLAGDLTSISNGSGVTLSYAYNSAARVNTVTSNWNDAQHPATLYTVDPSIGYFPGGTIRKATLPNGLTESAMYNKRLQPCRMEINSTAASFAQCTDAVPSGNVLDFTYGFNLGSSDNGNVATWSAVGNQTFTRSYTYDSLNRIKTLADTAASQACKGLSWTVDPWGNLTDQTVTSGSCLALHVAVGANNRLLSPYLYDAAGNITNDGSHSYTYDAENHLTQVDGGATASYIYDPNGNRVRKNSGGSWTEYFYDFSGNVTTEYNPSGWPVQYAYVGGRLVAQYRNGTTYSIFRDHLGSTRLITKLDKTVYDSLDFLPFGAQTSGDTGTTHKFTGKERDSESGLDNFGARFFSSSIGRFLSTDPGTVLAKDLANPQKWNRYGYVLNDPLKNVDPDGKREVQITVTRYVAQPFTIFPVPAMGDNRSTQGVGTYRTQQRITIETDPSRNHGNPEVGVSNQTGISAGASLNPNKTIVPGPGPVGFGVDKASGSSLSTTATRNENGSVTATFKANESYPLAPSPGISNDLAVTVTENKDGTATVQLTGSASIFPGIAVEEQSGATSALVYGNDHTEIYASPFNLFLPNQKVSGTVTIPAEKKKSQ